MTVRERILMIRLMEKTRRNQAYAKQLQIECTNKGKRK